MLNEKRNYKPLGIVALFAGVAETAGAIVLPLVASELQHIFIWYVMLFPALLLILFFVTLFFKPHVYYPPSEYRDEENYLKLNKRVDQIALTQKEHEAFIKKIVGETIEEAIVPISNEEIDEIFNEVFNKPD
ncbi:MAG: hypothetical protein FWG14_02625 [Peptococcaceae bacterium]|nr:hypothetical protein [Peptococcaceae bacterium]